MTCSAGYSFPGVGAATLSTMSKFCDAIVMSPRMHDGESTVCECCEYHEIVANSIGQEEMEVFGGECVGIGWKGGESGQSGNWMGRPRCANGECAGEARPRKYARWEWCGKCFKQKEGKVRIPGKTQGRWTVSCTNWNTAVGKLLGCSGFAREKKGEQLKMCSVTRFDCAETFAAPTSLRGNS